MSENAVPLILTTPPPLLSVREALVDNLRPLFRPPRMSSSRQLWRRAIYPFVLKTTSRTLPIYRRSSCMVLCGRPNSRWSNAGKSVVAGGPGSTRPSDGGDSELDISGHTFGVLYHRASRVPNHHRVGLFKPRQIAWSLNNFDEVLLDRVTSAEGNSGGRSLPAGFVSFEQ